MDLSHILKETPFYQSILEEGREEGRKEAYEKNFEEGRRRMMIKMFREFAVKRFPGLELGVELEQVCDIEALEQLCLSLDQIPDEATLRSRLAALIAV